MKNIYLVDVSSMFFRAFYAVRPLTSPQGLPTNAIYGFTSMIVKLLKDEKPDYLGFCYDLPTPSFRKDLYAEYKAHRSETPADLIPQIPYIKKMVDALGIPAFEIQGYEADDIIGTLTEIGRKHQCRVHIVSGDKDFAQLVRPGVELLDTMKDSRIDVDGVKAKWGVRPDQFIDYLALIGDASDNIPGIAGIGPKTAEKLLNDHGTLDEIYKQIESIKSAGLKEKLIKGKENAILSKKLATIVTNIPMSDDLNQLKPTPFKKEELVLLLRELNFKTLEKNLLNHDDFPSFLGPAVDMVPATPANTNHFLPQAVASCSSSSSVGLPQTNSTPPLYDELGIPLKSYKKPIPPPSSNPPANSVASPGLTELTPKEDDLREKLPSGSQVWAFYNRSGHYLVYKNYLWSFQNDFKKWGTLLTEKNLIYSGFDLKTFWRGLGIRSPQLIWDSQLAAYLIKTDHIGTFEETVPEFLLKNLPPFCTPSEEYKFHQELFHKLQTEIKNHGFYSLLHDIELPISPILLAMEQEGILLDLNLLQKQSARLAEDIHKLEQLIYSLSGDSFNIASPKQLSIILFEKLQLPASKKTKTGYSTDNEVLESLKETHPIIPPILEFRELTKLKSTYVDALPSLVDPETHRVHTHFNQALTSTGRLSSTQPNLQNIPIRTQRGQEIRQAFIAPPGSVLLSLDYSQIELRILAHLTEDPGLCNAFLSGQDIHAATASEVFEVAITDVTPDMRRAAKAINFGIAYGQGAYGLAENLGVSRTEAQNIIKRYFKRFQRVQEFMEATIAEAKVHGFVTNIFGRKRILRELKSSSPMLRKFGERAAINAPVQGAASDIVKKAMISVAEITEAKMLLQVHDELLFECQADQADDLMKALSHRMENVVALKTPLVVNGVKGSSWNMEH